MFSFGDVILDDVGSLPVVIFFRVRGILCSAFAFLNCVNGFEERV